MVWGSDFMLMGQYSSAKQFSHGVHHTLFYTLHKATLHIHFQMSFTYHLKWYKIKCFTLLLNYMAGGVIFLKRAPSRETAYSLAVIPSNLWRDNQHECYEAPEVAVIKHNFHKVTLNFKSVMWPLT